MKQTNLFLAIACSLVLISLASAQAVIDYSVYYGIQEPSGLLNESTTQINGARVDVYNCLNDDCSLVNPNYFYTYTAPSNSNKLVITYPTNLMNHGYAFYVYKEGYIGWEQYGIDWAGTGSAKGTDIYLTRKRIKTAPIVDFAGTNNSNCAYISANIVSPITDIRNTDIPLKENASVRTTFEVLVNGSLVLSQQVNNVLEYSGTKSVDFGYCNISSPGNYTLLLHTDITDDKILNKIRDTESFSLIKTASYEVCEEGQRRNTTLLNNYCSGLSIFGNYTYELCSGDEWVIRYESIFNRTCNGGILLEEGYCYGDNLIQNWSQPICSSGACGRSFFANQTVCEYGCSDGQCNPQPTPGLFLNIISPQDKTYTNNTILVNLSSNGTSVWYNWNGTNVSYSSPHYVVFNNGSNTLYAWANNSLGNLTYKRVSFFVNQTGGEDGEDGESISIVVYSPINNSIYKTSTVLLNASANMTANIWTYSLNGEVKMISLVPSDKFISSMTGLITGNYSLLVCGLINTSLGDCKTLFFQVIIEDEKKDDKKKNTPCIEPDIEEDIISLGNYTPATNYLLKRTESKEGNEMIWLWIILFLIAILVVLFLILRL